MEKPSISQKGPYKVKVEKDKTYFWCSCGKSSKQPFCDGSHKKTKKIPLLLFNFFVGLFFYLLYII